MTIFPDCSLFAHLPLHEVRHIAGCDVSAVILPLVMKFTSFFDHLVLSSSLKRLRYYILYDEYVSGESVLAIHLNTSKTPIGTSLVRRSDEMKKCQGAGAGQGRGHRRLFSILT